MDAVERNYQTIAFACREIRAREREREALIPGGVPAARKRPTGKALGGNRASAIPETDGGVGGPRSPSCRKRTRKPMRDLKEEKEVHRKAVDKLNLSLAFNQKLEAYVGNAGDVINKAQLFDANLAQHPVTAKKVIPVLVDFADKMEVLFDDMRVLFDGLLPEVPPIAAENLQRSQEKFRA